MSKLFVKLSALACSYLLVRHGLKTYDPIHYYYFAAKFKALNDAMRNVHQHTRKRELFRSAHGEVLELNAGAGLSLPQLPPTVSRYYANEPNPVLVPTLKQAAVSNGLPISHIENSTAIEILRAMGNNTMDSVILNGALRYETPKSTARIFREIHRVLRPGGFILMAEDVAHQGHQFAPFQERRRTIRNAFTGEQQTDFVIPLLNTFDSAYIEDWTCPPLGYHESHRERVQVILDYHQRHNADENTGEYLSRVPKTDLSFLYRPTYGGWAVKKTTAQGHEDLLQGRVTLDTLHQFTQLLSKTNTNSVQQKRDERAKHEGYQYDAKFVQSARASVERQAKKKPTQPKGGYVGGTPIPVTILSALGLTK